MDLGIRGRSYVVFGGSAGIGLAAARALVADGASVVLAARGARRLDAAVEELSGSAGSTVLGVRCDLTEADDAERAVATATDAFGGIDGMAVTTGLGMRGQRDLFGAADEDWAATFEDVLLSTVRACRASVPALVARGGGSIVTTAAYSIRAPKAHQVPYGALKGSIAVLTKNLATTFGGQGVRANCVCPGATETEVLASMRTHYAAERDWPVDEALERVMVQDWGMQVALGRPGRPEELGDVIAFLLSERASYLTGATINVDGGTDF
ncbi:MAG: SDR family oxidoreductase [Microthrixaceae bacterium]